MTVLFATIPVMILAIAVATVPLLYAMRKERAEYLAAVVVATAPQADEEVGSLAA